MFESSWDSYYIVNRKRKGGLILDGKKFLANLCLAILIIISIIGYYSCTRTDPAWLHEFPESNYVFPNAED